MKQSNYIAAEFKRMVSKRSVLISVGVALLVPLVYAMIMLSPKWGPQDNIDNLPIAIVNNDLGANNDGELVNVGDELVGSLQENRTLGWEFVSSEEANKGMDDMKYYMSIEVPEDFSKKVITVMDDEPMRPELKFTQNEGLHYMAAQVTDRAIDTIKEQLSAQITQTYVKSVVDQLGEVGDGFEEAADGAFQINDGTKQLKDGSNLMLNSLIDKSSDITRLADGSKELNAGTNELLTNLNGKSSDISRLADGANQLSVGAGQLKAGTSELKAGTGELKAGTGELKAGAGELKAGTGELKAGTGELKAGTKELEAGTKELKAGSAELLAGAKQAKDGSKQLRAGLQDRLTPGSAELYDGVLLAQQGVNETIESMGALEESLTFLSTLDKEHPVYDGIFNEVLSQLTESLKSTPQKEKDFQRLVDGAKEIRNGLQKGSEFYDGMAQLDNGLGDLAAGAGELDAGAAKLTAGASELDAGAAKLKAGAGQLNAGAGQLNDGAGQLNAGAGQLDAGASQLDSGAGDLSAGSVQVADGNQTVRSGWTQLQDGATQLHDGSTQISDGTGQVETGWGELTDGTTQIDDGLLQVVDGSAELHDGLKGGAERVGELDPQEENIVMFAEPIVLDGEVINSFPFYRDANAPYIITLALFVGALAMSFVLPYRRPAILPPSAISWFSGKVVKLAALATAQALIISLYSLLVLKIQVHSSLLFILFSIWVSLTFLMIVLFLVVLAGNIGRFAALAFAVIQLSTTGSDLPIHMLPEGLRNLSVFLPFTYSIDGFKNIITLGKTSIVWANVGVLFLYVATFGILSAVVFFIRYRRVGDEIDYEEESTESAL